MNKQHVYFCIDLKSFYASVECAERGLDPRTTDLVVADTERGERTICLAVSPSLREKGVKNRCRLYEIPENLEYLTAIPRMQKYIDYSADIYGIYLNYFSSEDIYVYSVDEVFIDVTPYLKLYKETPGELARFLINEVERITGVPAACGIGSNLYLAKIALDITAKHSKDAIGFLDERRYRETLWDYKPLSDFWRVGKKTEGALREIGIECMRDIARCNEDSLYALLGVDAELLIDHAWGREPVTIADIKTYEPKGSSLGNGQILPRDYGWKEAETVVREMTEKLALELFKKSQLCSSLSLIIGYSRTCSLPAARGTCSFPLPSNAESFLTAQAGCLFEKIVNRDAPVRKITISCNNLVEDTGAHQISLFEIKDNRDSGRGQQIQETISNIKKRFGENAVLKGHDLCPEATAMERNRQIGGHKSGNA